jgi:hypothetical protein
MPELSEKEIDRIKHQAHLWGVEVGENAAEWYAQDSFGGRVTRGAKESARKVLKMLEDGDPEIYDSVRLPDLSGEWAGDPTPQTLAENAGLDEENDPEGFITDELCDEWEEGVSEGFFDKLANLARAEVENK